ncbi:MAG: hypothetical protein JW787_04355 [Sedimentisphaerales bacterium]|nr:hypothetical protein [Sedimentisphaerales bacterium]
MILVNWAEAFEEPKSFEDIEKKVKYISVQYWIYLIIAVAIGWAGLRYIAKAPEGDMKKLAYGICMVVAGIVQVAIVKLWAHMKIITYFMIWERRKWIEDEIKKSEAADI